MRNNENHPSKTRVELHSKDYKKKSRVLAWIISIIAILVVAAAAYSTYVYFKTKNAVDHTYDTNNRVEVKKMANLMVRKKIRCFAYGH